MVLLVSLVASSASDVTSGSVPSCGVSYHVGTMYLCTYRLTSVSDLRIPTHLKRRCICETSCCRASRNTSMLLGL